jgi:hypothetical protein
MKRTGSHVAGIWRNLNIVSASVAVGFLSTLKNGQKDFVQLNDNKKAIDACLASRIGRHPLIVLVCGASP